MAIRRGSSRFKRARRGTGRDWSEGEPSAAEMPDGQLKRRLRVVWDRMGDAWRRSKLKSASNRLVAAVLVVEPRRNGPCVRVA